jgi:predicted outer membrane protein
LNLSKDLAFGALDKMAPLKAAAGAQFDKAFARAMLEDHTKDVEAKAARDAPTYAKLRSLLDATIPVSERDGETARMLVTSLDSASVPAGAIGLAPKK